MQFFSEEQQKNIISAIKNSEKNTSGEIKVHVEPECLGANAYDRAKEVFEYLSLHKTALRNGVLFYLAYNDHKFSVLGDTGINNKVGQSFWDSTVTLLNANFKNGDFEKGLCLAITEAGKQLKMHFPYNNNDKNEIGDDISFG
jgi:uncharacterized membrane protein